MIRTSPRTTHAPSDAAPIFVVGSGRSGTTLLRMMLCAHPRIYLTHEAYFYVWSAALPRGADGRALVEAYLRSFSFRWLRVDVDDFLPDVPADLPRARGHVLFEAVMRAKARQMGKERYGDKTPPHSGHLARIYEDFPRARVIRIVRDPRAVAHSLSRMPWSSGTALFGAWVNEIERRQVEAFRDRMLQVRLEDLLDDPRKVMGAVLDFVGEPWDDRVLDHATHGPGPDDPPPFPWFRAASEARAAKAVAPWAEWDAATLRMVERVSRGAMVDGGYAPATLDREPTTSSVARAYLREAPRVARDVAVMGRLVRAGLETPAQKALFRTLNPDAWTRMPGFVMPDPPPLRDDWARTWGARVDAPRDVVTADVAPPSTARAWMSPLYAGAIWAEDRAARATSVRLRFPRDVAEIDAAPERLFLLLRDRGALPEGATLVAVRRRGGFANEPDKDRTAASYDVVARDGDETVTTPVFVKFQTGRGMPLLLQGVRAAVEPGIAREVEFYRRLAGTVPLRAPRPYVADSLTAVNRVCLALEHVEGDNPADWRGCALGNLRAMLGDVARMNAAFVGRTALDPRTRWIPARAGLDHAAFVVTLAGAAPDWYMDLWRALDRFFRARPVTLVHGDCRPGNMLFRDDDGATRRPLDGDEDTAAPWPAPDAPRPSVVFTDWEAINAAPLLWDFTYCTIIGLRVGDRRAHLPRLLDEFVAALREAGAPESLCDVARCRVEVDALAMVLYYVAALVVSKGYWDRQGNTLNDYRAWSGRILAALRDVDVARVAAAIEVAPDAVRRLQREASFKERTEEAAR